MTQSDLTRYLAFERILDQTIAFRLRVLGLCSPLFLGFDEKPSPQYARFAGMNLISFFKLLNKGIAGMNLFFFFKLVNEGILHACTT